MAAGVKLLVSMDEPTPVGWLVACPASETSRLRLVPREYVELDDFRAAAGHA